MDKKPVQKYYVTSEEFHNEYKLSEEQNKPTDKLIRIFEKIAKNYSTRFRGNKLDIDACVNYATFEAYQKWNKFDSTRSPNIFAFFTQMIKNDLAIHHNKIFHKKELHISIDAMFSGNSEH